MKKYLSELLGTFAIVFFGTGAVVVNEQTGGTITHLGVALTFGLIVMAMIYTLGNVSGAHMNPAVTIAFTIARRFPPKLVLPYICSQLAGALLGSLLLHLLFPTNRQLGATLPSGTAMQSFILESVLTFFLMLVILNVATGSKEQGMFAGLAIGGTVLLMALFAGPISGASMNPARSIAPAVVSRNFSSLWIYVIAPVISAAAAVPVWQYLNKPINTNQ